MKLIEKMMNGVSKRTLALTLTLVLALATATGGTLAWLVDQTDPVTNTFTYGDVDIDLEEDESDDGDDGDGDPNTNTYQMLPGKEISKRPYVTAHKGSEDCYVFVKIEESENFADFMTYEVAEGWTALEGVEGVYYREVNKTDVADEDAVYEVLKDNQVKVLDTVTSEMLRELDADGANNYPTLTFTAYAVQRDAEIESISTAANAWAAIQAEPETPDTGADTLVNP